MALTISRILHAGYVFDCGGTRIAFDPIVENPFSRNCHAFPAVRFDAGQVRAQRFAAVFISHLHDDHCSLESLDLLDRATPIYLYCVFDELFALIGALGFQTVHRLQTDVPVAVGPFVVTPRAAFDADVDSLFQIEAGGLKVLNVVDAWIGDGTLDQLARFAPWDMVLWPFQTMRELAVLSPSRAGPASQQLPDDWIPQLAALRPRFVVPSSCQFLQEPWSWYNHAFFPITYRQFQREVEAGLPAARVQRLDPGQSVTLDANGLAPAAPLPWVIPVGPQDVDYDFRPDAPVPRTADIARHFGALTPEQHGRVIDYCRSGLPARYRSMELPGDSYFEQPRCWRLALYDHQGAETVFTYRVWGDTIALLDEAPETLSWTTELPLAKLYAGLALGESLTSMYMRINDAVFDARTEADLEQADLLDDPLIRCLFDDAIGAYQAAQLRRLQGCV